MKKLMRIALLVITSVLAASLTGCANDPNSLAAKYDKFASDWNNAGKVGNIANAVANSNPYPWVDKLTVKPEIGKVVDANLRFRYVPPRGDITGYGTFDGSYTWLKNYIGCTYVLDIEHYNSKNQLIATTVHQLGGRQAGTKLPYESAFSDNAVEVRNIKDTDHMAIVRGKCMTGDQMVYGGRNTPFLKK